MGRTEKREPVGRLAALMLHLLKWRVQPIMSSVNWGSSMERRRRGKRSDPEE